MRLLKFKNQGPYSKCKTEDFCLYYLEWNWKEIFSTMFYLLLYNKY